MDVGRPRPLAQNGRSWGKGDGHDPKTPGKYLRVWDSLSLISSRSRAPASTVGKPFFSFSRTHSLPFQRNPLAPKARRTQSKQSRAKRVAVPLESEQSEIKKMPSHRCAGWQLLPVALTALLLVLTLAPPAACADAESPPLLLHREVQAVSETHATQFGACARKLLLQRSVFLFDFWTAETFLL